MKPWNLLFRCIQRQIFFLVCLAAFPYPAWSHAVLIESVPPHEATLDKAPETILLKFNAALEHVITQVYLIDLNKDETALEQAKESSPDRIVVQVPPLSPGVYTILYKVLARDGHVTQGSIRFTLRGS